MSDEGQGLTAIVLESKAIRPSLHEDRGPKLDRCTYRIFNSRENAGTADKILKKRFGYCCGMINNRVEVRSDRQDGVFEYYCNFEHSDEGDDH